MGTISLNNSSVSENTTGAEIGTLQLDTASNSNTYFVSDDRFEVIGDTLKLKDNASLIYANEPTVSISVISDDGNGNMSFQEFTIDVIGNNGDENHEPTNLNLTNTSVVESTSGASVGKITFEDEDTNDTHSYFVSDDRFEVNDKGELKLKDGVSLNYDEEPQVTISVVVDDGQGGMAFKEFTIEVTEKSDTSAELVPSIKIVNIGDDGIVDYRNGETTRRLNGKIDLDDTEFLSGHNVNRLQGINIIIDGKKYHAGLNDKNYNETPQSQLFMSNAN